MITLTDNGIRWGREDVRLMSKIIGSEAAVIGHKEQYRTAPPLLSIVKLAHRKGGYVSKRALRALRVEVSIHKAIEEIKRAKDGAITDPRAAKYFKHQRADLSYLYSVNPRGVLVAHEAGVGKTLLGIRYPEHQQAKRIMVIAPNAAKEQWAGEIERWSTARLPITIVQGTVAQQVAQIKGVKRGWCIGHWESLAHAREGWLARPWDAAVLDEIQHIQNRQAQRTETVFKLKADWRMALTAHPYANSTDELFPILKFLYPTIYTSFWRWAHLHIEIDEAPFGGLDLSTPRRPSLLKWEIAPFTIRRMWKQVWKNLPPITRIQRTAYLTTKGANEYKRLKKQFFVELAVHDGERNILAIPSVLARVTRLRQYLTDPGLLGASEPSVKYPIILDLVRELDGRPPVIFTMWREAALRLRAYLRERKLRVAIIVGGMQSKINPIKHKFLRGRYDAVIIMIKVGGTSLNFGKYGSIIYLDMPWNQRDVEQTEGRVRRPEEGTGKIVPATSYRVIVKNSYEERMAQLRKDKHEDFEKVFTVARARELFE